MVHVCCHQPSYTISYSTWYILDPLPHIYTIWLQSCTRFSVSCWLSVFEWKTRTLQTPSDTEMSDFWSNEVSQSAAFLICKSTRPPHVPASTPEETDAVWCHLLQNLTSEADVPGPRSQWGVPVRRHILWRGRSINPSFHHAEAAVLVGFDHSARAPRGSHFQCFIASVKIDSTCKSVFELKRHIFKATARRRARISPETHFICFKIWKQKHAFPHF